MTTTPDYAAIVRTTFPSAQRIAETVGVHPPENNDSAGAMWLLKVREHYADEWDRILNKDYPSDHIEYQPFETMKDTQWAVFTDLKLWQFDADVTYNRHAGFTRDYPSYGTEKLPAIKVEDLPDLAADLMGEIANNIGHMMLQTVMKAAEDNEEDAE